jgi:putative Mn2+ efflux pump MntP
MLSAKEKRFIHYWEEQREGGKLKYILLYSLVWGFVFFLIPLAVSVIVDFYSTLKMYKIPLWAAMLIFLLLGFAFSIYSWHKNENKLKVIYGKQS